MRALKGSYFFINISFTFFCLGTPTEQVCQQLEGYIYKIAVVAKVSFTSRFVFAHKLSWRMYDDATF